MTSIQDWKIPEGNGYEERNLYRGCNLSKNARKARSLFCSELQSSLCRCSPLCMICIRSSV
jgi:hypothetical protein